MSRNVIVSTFLTVDGVMEAPENWTSDFHDEQNMKDALELVLEAGALLLGRRTYEIFAGSWPTRTDPMGFADKMNTIPKYVVSMTLTDPTWNETTVIDSDVTADVAKLKKQSGGDLLIYGSGQLTRTLMEAGLIDEYRFLLCPVVAGKGAKLFDDDVTATLSATDAHLYPGGMTRLTFVPSA